MNVFIPVKRDRDLGPMCKFGLKRSYDRVDKDFLLYMLSMMGFGDLVLDGRNGFRIVFLQQCHWSLSILSNIGLN